MAETTQQDYFAFVETVNRFELPDGSFIEHKPLDEGAFQKYQGLTSRIKLGADGGSTEVDMALGEQRNFLFRELVTGWNFIGGGKPVRYSYSQLQKLPPHILNGLLEDIHKKNPILAGEDEEEGKDS